MPIKRLPDHIVKERRDKFLHKLEETHGDSVKLLSTYRTVKEKIKVLCNECGTKWTTTPQRLVGKRQQGCPECGKIRKAESQKITIRTKTYRRLEDALRTKYDNRIKCLTTEEEYVYSEQNEYDDTKVHLKCKCGNTWMQTPKVLINYNLRYACNACASKNAGYERKILLEKRLAAIDVVHSGTITVLSKIPRNYTPDYKVEFECNECGHIWKSKLKLVAAGSGCQACAAQKNLYTPKRLSYAVDICGKQHILFGYEPQAVRWILNNTKVKEKDINTNPPKFKYKKSGKEKIYIPDLEITGRDTIVEVKSLGTAGLGSQTKMFSLANLKAKAKAVENQGYKFILMVMHKDGHRIKMPDNWRTMTRREIIKELKA